MRTLLVIVAIVVIVAVMAFGGWLVFDVGGNRAAVEVDTDKIQSDTEQAWEESKELLQKAEDAM